MVLYIILITLTVCSLILFVPAINQFFEFIILPRQFLLISVAVGITSVLWIELYKFILRKKSTKNKTSDPLSLA
jgi:Ca2+-transporting ATPase